MICHEAKQRINFPRGKFFLPDRINQILFHLGMSTVLKSNKNQVIINRSFEIDIQMMF